MFKHNSTQNIFSQTGPLCSKISNFQSRPEQQKMAQAIENAFVSSQKLIIEAGTGTGKTFAYLVPTFLSDQKIIISTGTKNLQSQLYEKDIPLIQQALQSTKKIVLLKGRANYLCLYRLHRNLHEGLFFSKQVIDELEQIRDWSTTIQTGDLAELSHIPENSTVWPYVTSHNDNCLGSDCPFFEKCYVMKARHEAQTAHILVINHHLFMADLILKEEGFDDLLPGANIVIFDEAHQLPQTATQFFGMRISSYQITELANDIRHEYLFTARDIQELETFSENLQRSVLDCRLSFDEEPHKGTWHEITNHPERILAIENLISQLDVTNQHLSDVITRSKGLENCWRRSLEIAAQLKLLMQNKTQNTIRWFETFSKSFMFHITPLDMSELFKTAMQRYKGSWIFTSATITADNHFTYFSENLGLQDAKNLQLDSPFHYEKQTLLYIPPNLPYPNNPAYTKATVNAMIPVFNASKGRAFFLFTSFRALHEAYELLTKRVHYPLLVQGSLPKPILLDKFRLYGNAILLGTHSFWEGVDVRGETLSCVIIDRLPFSSPDEPILKARIENLRQQGKDPFSEYQLPQAVVSLKQGIGRLIRDQNDTGLLVVCDPRILTRPYGKIFLDSLPKMPVTRRSNDIVKFFDRNI
jgi:ATP-dependent DNA helicase DinG